MKKDKTLKYSLEVEIKNIEIFDGEYYSFDFTITQIGGKILADEPRIIKGKYDGDFDSQTASAFKKTLENGYAAQLALEQIM